MVHIYPPEPAGYECMHESHATKNCSNHHVQLHSPVNVARRSGGIFITARHVRMRPHIVKATFDDVSIAVSILKKDNKVVSKKNVGDTALL